MAADILHQYHRWSLNMHARRAAQGFEKGDYEHAILDGRRLSILIRSMSRRTASSQNPSRRRDPTMRSRGVCG